jgi:hypothetical protein
MTHTKPPLRLIIAVFIGGVGFGCGAGDEGTNNSGDQTGTSSADNGAGWSEDVALPDGTKIIAVDWNLDWLFKIPLTRDLSLGPDGEVKDSVTLTRSTWLRYTLQVDKTQYRTCTVVSVSGVPASPLPSPLAPLPVICLIRSSDHTGNCVAGSPGDAPDILANAGIGISRDRSPDWWSKADNIVVTSTENWGAATGGPSASSLPYVTHPSGLTTVKCSH